MTSIANAERAELAATIEDALTLSRGIIAWTGAAQEEIADAILAAGYQRHAKVYTTSDLDDMPEGSAVMDETETIALQIGRGLWSMGGDEYTSEELTADWLTLPATVLHVGGTK